MYPLDFEEFLWACGITASVIESLKKSMEDETPIPEALHNRMRGLLLQYAVVGGMPDIGRAGEILTLPLYTAFLLREY